MSDFEGDALEANVARPGWLERHVRAHQTVLEALLSLTTVVPMRFGSIFSTRTFLRQMLEDNADALKECLEGVRGKLEWGLKLYRMAEEKTEAPPAHSGRDYLLRRSAQIREAEDAEAAAASIAQDVYERLAKCSDGAVFLKNRRDGDALLLLNAAYLVSDDRREEFKSRARTLQHAHPGLVLEITGPWPAYNFTKLDVAGVRSS